jgi:hypothetical protein
VPDEDSVERCEVVARVKVQVRVEFERFRRPRPRGAGRHKWLIEDTAKYELYRDRGIDVRVRRVFDRDQWCYLEHIDIPLTGEVVRRVKEPLPVHRDHGSAKMRRPEV